MSDNLNNIGEVFRNSLKDLKMESNGQLWNRLDKSLSSQPIVTPKKVLLHTSHVSWVSVAAAASLISFVALAAYYFSPKTHEATIANTKQNNKQPNNVNNIKDSTLYVNNSDTAKVISLDNKEEITNITPKSSNNIENKSNPELNKQYHKPELEKKNKKTDNNTLTPNSNNNNPPQQFTNNSFNNVAPNNYNQSPYTQPNNAANNNKTIKNNTTTNIQQLAVIPNNNKITPKDTARAINTIDNNTVVNKNENVIKPEQDVKELKIPNVFTPNGDGVNDYFVINNLETCSSAQLKVCDRNGRVVFETNSYHNEWDGHGLPDGVYFYSFIYHRGAAGGVKQGSVTIKR
ncbi:MAG: gliding motility-associated C-terminal domain-containing protein [Bacteroidota bacterium]